MAAGHDLNPAERRAAGAAPAGDGDGDRPPSPMAKDADALEAAWGRLRHHLDWLPGHWYGWALSSDGRVLAELRTRAGHLLAYRGRQMVLLRPASPGELVAAAGELAERAPRVDGCLWLEAGGADLPGSPPRWDDAWRETFRLVNARRDTLRAAMVRSGILFAGPPRVAEHAKAAGPDLWSIRSVVLGVEAPRAVLHPGLADDGDRTGAAAHEAAEPAPRADFSGRLDEPDLEAELAALPEGARLRDLLRRAVETGGADAIAALEEALALADAAGAPAASAYGRVQLAEALHEDRDPARAYSLLREAAGGLGGRALLHALGRLGELGQRRRDLPVAARWFDEAAAQARALADAVPTPQARRDLSVSLNNVGRARAARGDWAGAEEAYVESLGLRRALAEAAPTPQARRDLSLSLDHVGQARAARGDWAGAEEAYAESLGLARALAEAAPTPQARRDLSLSLDHVGRAREARGDSAGAEGAYAESLGLRRALADAVPTPEARRDLSVSLDNVGRARAARGDWAGAEGAYAESLGLARALAEAAPTPQARRDLSVSLNNVGRAGEARGDWAGAEGAYGESLGLRRALAEAVPTPQARRDLSVALDNVGRARAARGDRAGAEELWDELEALARRATEVHGDGWPAEILPVVTARRSGAAPPGE